MLVPLGYRGPADYGTLEIGVHGCSEVNQRLLVAVAEHLRLVRPST
jgi:hypothetical protein